MKIELPAVVEVLELMLDELKTAAVRELQEVRQLLRHLVRLQGGVPK